MSSQSVSRATVARRPALVPIWLIMACALGCGATGIALAQLGAAGVLAASALGALSLGLLLIRERELFVLLAMIASFQVVLHKSIGPIASDVSSGALSVYITSFDVLLVLLYGLWMMSGHLTKDLKAVWGQPLYMLPLVAIASALPSLLVAPDLYLALGELVRMLWMYALFLYVAMRVRSRREVSLVVGVLCLVVVAQFAVALLQSRTGSSLGLAFLGEQDALGVRTADGTEIPRPSGTVIHPDFLAALVAPIALLAFAVSVEVRRGLWLRVACLAITAVAAVTIVLAQARAALVGFAVGLALLVTWYVVRRQLSGRIIAAAGAAALVAGVLFSGPIADQVVANLGTDHFQLEIQSRLQLNGVAVEMFGDNALIGVGLNNFEQVMDRYDRYGLIFAENPVHDLYLLVAAETGLIGAVGFVLSAGAIVVLALRCARLPSGLLAATGAAVLATLAFFGVEELLTFSLRHDMPLATFWLLAGLAVACVRIDARERGSALIV